MCSIPPRKSGAQGPEWADLYEIVGATHRKYCERWGYAYYLDVSDIWEPINPTIRGLPKGESKPIYYKIKFLLFQHFLDPDSCLTEYDWVVWLDGDLLITNYDKPLNDFFNGMTGDQGYRGDLVYAHDPNGLHATVIMMRRSPLTLGYAFANGDAGMRYFGQDYWSDQLSARMFLQTPPYRDLVVFHSIKELCAMPPDVYTHIPERARKPYEWEPGDFALHLSALSIAQRIELATKWVQEYNLL